MSVRDIPHKFRNVRRSGDGWTAQCSAHDDTRNSLSVGDGEGGRLLLYCHAGCTYEAICEAAGIDSREGEQRNAKQFRAAYDYRDEQGVLLYQVLRKEPKGFVQRKPEGNGWTYKLNGVRRVLYRLPDIIRAAAGSRVFVVEGEKDADRLASLGLAATTNAAALASGLPSSPNTLAAFTSSSSPTTTSRAISTRSR